MYDTGVIQMVEGRRLTWYGHIQRIKRWRHKICQWQSTQRGVRGHSKRAWFNEVKKVMQSRNLEEGDWADRKA